MKSQREIVKILRRVRPKHPDDLEGILNLTELGSGCSRQVYQIIPGRTVIKFSMDVRCAHARREMRAIARMRKFRYLRRYIPRIVYQDYGAGVIAMELLRTDDILESDCRILGDLIHDTFGTSHCLDFGTGNLGYGSWNQLKILDFGCI